MRDRLTRLRRNLRAIGVIVAILLALVVAVVVHSAAPAHAQRSAQTAHSGAAPSGALATRFGGPAPAAGRQPTSRRLAARARGGAPGHPGTPATAPSGTAVAQALHQATGLSPAQVTARDVCPPVAKGQARCAGETLVLRSSGVPVRPHVRAQASLGRVRPGRSRPGATLAAAPSLAPPQVDTPAYLEQAYDLSYLSQTGGSGDTVAIVDAFDDPTAETDLAVYRSTYGLPACTTQNGCFQKVNGSGATSPLPAADGTWDAEISIDLDAVSAVCPNCHILLVEAQSDLDTDMNAAVQTAHRMNADQISASWTLTESTAPSDTYTFPGVATVAASGDEGYVGPGEDNYPAAFAGVTAAGGTTLTPASSVGVRGFSEGAWSGGGSGCDVNVGQPSYQPHAGCAGRAYADVSADADPSTGLEVYVNGSWGLYGGTSLATPLIAAYYAITDAPAATPQWAYTDSAQLNDIVTGSTGSCSAAITYVCNAGPGYDGPTGVGSISGAVATGAPGIGGPSIGSGSGDTYTQSTGSHGATVAGGIYRNGLNTKWWIEYGTTTAYGNQTTAAGIGAGSAPVAVTGDLSGLAPGTTYHYRLVAQNVLGTTYGYDYTLTTAPAASTAPTASFSASTSTPAPGASVSFDASGSTGGSGFPITNYNWNFGDGDQDAGASATDQHTYTTRGTYQVTLTVTDGAGTDSTTHTVTVDDPPTAAFTPSATLTAPAIPGATVSFDASASAPGASGGTITDYSWDFGDGTPVDDAAANSGASHVFASPGIYTVTLTTTDDLGVSTTATQQITIDQPVAAFTTSPPGVIAPGTTVGFDASGSTDPESAIDDYSWNFGQGITVDTHSSPTVQHKYWHRGAHTVTLTVTNDLGQTSTATQTVTVDDPPTAAFTPSATLTAPAAPGATVSFDASASAPGASGGTITDYSWNFGDGTPVDDTAANSGASHAFASPGIYTVTLTTTDDLGVSAIATQQITIDQPVPAFVATPTVAAPTVPVSFDAGGSSDPEGAINDYSWNFGDGSPVDDTGTSATDQHAYASRGAYTVRLTVTNNYGQTSTTTHTVTVDDPPTAAFTPSASVNVPAAPFSFGASASAPGASGGTIRDYSWDFGDGTPVDDTGVNAGASHAFASPGTYTVTLTVTDDLGVSATTTQQITVDAPVAAFGASPRVAAPGAPVTLDASGSRDPVGTITDYSWNFGDGTSDQDTGATSSAQHTYAGRGAYTVTLTVANDHGQTSTTTHDVTVDNPPIAAFTPSATVTAPGATVSFDASASAPGAGGGTIDAYSWNFGDGTPADDAGGNTGASHAFASPGTYTVTLIATDDLGVSTTTNHEVTVQAPAPPATTVSPNPPTSSLSPAPTSPARTTSKPLTLALSVAKRQRLAAVAAHGLRIRLSVNASAKVTFQITIPRAETHQPAGKATRVPLARTATRTLGAGTYSIALRLSKAELRELSGSGPLVLTVRVTVTGAGGVKLTRSAKLTLQR